MVDILFGIPFFSANANEFNAFIKTWHIIPFTDHILHDEPLMGSDLEKLKKWGKREYIG